MTDKGNKNVRPSAPQLEGMVPYDPKYLRAETYLSANENPYSFPNDMEEKILNAIRDVDMNRYPDPLAESVRYKLADMWDIDRENILVGNGGDELLFNIALAWGGPGRTVLTLPPTFSVYETNAVLTGTNVLSIPLTSTYQIDEEAVLHAVGAGNVDCVMVTSPNNPTGQAVDASFIKQILESSDALVVVDEAYGEFSDTSMVPYLGTYKNLIVLRTLSKAYGLAGVRLGYVLADRMVIRELMKVRQPYSVNAVSQAIAFTVLENRELMADRVKEIIAQRDWIFEQISSIDSITPYPSDANFILFKVDNADLVWDSLYEQGILIRNFAHAAKTESCLRVTVGTPQENQQFVSALHKAIERV